MLSKVPAATVTTFTRELAALVQAGVLLTDALQVLAAGTERNKESKLAHQLYTALEQGKSFKAALQQHPQWFDAFYIHMADAGFRAGALGEFLQALVDYRSNREEFMQKIKRAITYPAFVCVLSILITIALLVQVVPRFEHIFANAGESLPAITNWILGLSNWLIQYGWYMLGGMVIMLLLLRVIARWQPWQICYQQILWIMPIIGKWRKTRIKEAYLRSLSTMVGAKIPLVDATATAAGGCSDTIRRQWLQSIPEALRAGRSMENAFAAVPIFSRADALAARLGSKGADLSRLLGASADHYQSRLTEGLQSLLRLLEPCLMVFIGIIIGLLVLAIYLPLFSIGQVL